MLWIHVIWQTDLKPLSVTNAKNGEQTPFLAYRGYKQVMQGVTKQVSWWGGTSEVFGRHCLGNRVVHVGTLVDVAVCGSKIYTLRGCKCTLCTGVGRGIW